MTQTVDTFKAGDPDTPVTGIAVTMMATLDVLQRAAANHQNLIITHEPTFFSHQDTPEGMDQSDPSGPRSGASSNSTIWSCGGFTMTGIGCTPTAFSPEWSML